MYLPFSNDSRFLNNRYVAFFKNLAIFLSNVACTVNTDVDKSLTVPKKALCVIVVMACTWMPIASRKKGLAVIGTLYECLFRQTKAETDIQIYDESILQKCLVY